jgi:hypothetical protein
MGTASNFGVLAATSVSNTNNTVIAGDLGDTGAPGSISGFPPGVVLGTNHTPNDAASILAVADIIAYNAALNTIPCTTTYTTTATDIGGSVLGPGVYCFTTSGQVTGTVTFDGRGNADSQFILRVGTQFTGTSGSTVALINGAQACGITLQTGTSAVFSGTGGVWMGNIIAQTIITATNAWRFVGSLFAPAAGVGAVTLINNSITNVTSCGGQLATVTANFTCTLGVTRLA